MITIVPLDKNNITGALEVITEVFHKEPSAPISMLASVGVEEVQKHSYLAEVPWRKYWVAQDETTKEILGVIGLYTTKEDEAEAFWVNWFAVHPKGRKKGVGRQLLTHMCQEAKERKACYLRLWTSNQPRERAAQFLYEDMGFHTVSRRWTGEWSFKWPVIITRERKLM